MTENPYESPKAEIKGVDRSAWPLMVRLGLWGLPSAGSAWAFFWLSVVLAIGCIAYGLIDQRFYLGAVLLFAALWYYSSIRWVERNSRWK